MVENKVHHRWYYNRDREERKSDGREEGEVQHGTFEVLGSHLSFPDYYPWFIHLFSNISAALRLILNAFGFTWK